MLSKCMKVDAETTVYLYVLDVGVKQRHFKL
jgi:hypothetical protein